jgi:hypothetical protein
MGDAPPATSACGNEGSAHSAFAASSSFTVVETYIRTGMRGPLVANVSRRLSAPKISSRVFCGAQTPVIPPGPNSGSESLPAVVSSRTPMCPGHSSSFTAPGIALCVSVDPMIPISSGLPPPDACMVKPVASPFRTIPGSEPAGPGPASIPEICPMKLLESCSNEHSGSASVSPGAHSLLPLC